MNLKFLGIFYGLIFLRLDRNEKGVRDRLGILVNLLMTCNFGFIFNVVSVSSCRFGILIFEILIIFLSNKKRCILLRCQWFTESRRIAFILFYHSIWWSSSQNFPNSSFCQLFWFRLLIGCQAFWTISKYSSKSYSLTSLWFMWLWHLVLLPTEYESIHFLINSLFL